MNKLSLNLYLLFSVIYVQDSLEGEPRVFLDPNTLSEDGTVSFLSLFMYRIRGRAHIKEKKSDFCYCFPFNEICRSNNSEIAPYVNIHNVIM